MKEDNKISLPEAYWSPGRWSLPYVSTSPAITQLLFAVEKNVVPANLHICFAGGSIRIKQITFQVNNLKAKP